MGNSQDVKYSVFDTLPIGHLVIDTSGIIHQANLAVAAMLGQERNELEGKPFELFLRKGEKEKFDEFLDRLKSLGRSGPADICIAGVGVRQVRLTGTPESRQGTQGFFIVTLTDITDLFLIDSRLKHEYEVFRRIVETAVEGIWVLDREAHSTYLNNAAACMIGHRADDLLGRSPLDFVISAERETLAAMLEACTRNVNFRRETRMVSKAGKVISVLVSGTSVFDPSGEFQGSVCVISDLSEFFSLRQELHLTRDRLQAAINSVAMTVFSQDRDLRYIWIYRSKNSRPAPDVAGKTDDDIYAPELASHLGTVKRTILETGETRREVVPGIVEGAETYYDLTLSPIRDTSGAIIGIRGVAIDITDRTRTENVLKANNQRLRSLIETSSAPTAMLDEQGIIIAISSPAAALIGYDSSALVGRDAHELIPHAEWPVIAKLLKRMHEGAEITRTGLMHAVHRNGSKVWLELDASIIMVEERIRGYVVALSAVEMA